MRYKLTLPEKSADYIRHARIETLKAVGGDIHSSLVEPVPCAIYLLAYTREKEQPIGMAECAFHDQIYRSYDDMPYASLCDFEEICPFPQMGGMRTVFVEPEYRTRRPVFLHLVLAAAHVYRELGARFATASTNAADSQLGKLYERIGGRLVGQLSMDGVYDSLSSIFVFNLDQLLQHKAARRAVGNLEADLRLARDIRIRSALAS